MLVDSGVKCFLGGGRSYEGMDVNVRHNIGMAGESLRPVKFRFHRWNSLGDKFVAKLSIQRPNIS